MNKQQSAKPDNQDEFSSMAHEQDPGLIAEFWDFLIHNKKWWLTPIILVLLLMGLLVMLSGMRRLHLSTPCGRKHRENGSSAIAANARRRRLWQDAN